MRSDRLGLWLLIAVMPTVGAAQQRATFRELLGQAKGKIIVVVGTDNHSQTGQLHEISEDSLTIIKHDGRLALISSDEIRQVYAKAGRSRKRGALWGFTIGGASGAILGAAIAQPCDVCIISTSRGQGAAVGSAAGALVGTVTGVLLGSQKKILLYDRGLVPPPGSSRKSDGTMLGAEDTSLLPVGPNRIDKNSAR